MWKHYGLSELSVIVWVSDVEGCLLSRVPLYAEPGQGQCLIEQTWYMYVSMRLTFANRSVERWRPQSKW